MIVTPKSRIPAEVAIAVAFSCAESVPANVRLASLRKKLGRALRGHGGVWIQTPVQRIMESNVGKDQSSSMDS